jgi:hypothetical protein
MLVTFKELVQATAVRDPCELFPGQELADAVIFLSVAECAMDASQAT